MKKNGTLIVVAVVFTVMMLIMSSCAASDVRDFQDGFRRGWNSTASPEYRY